MIRDFETNARHEEHLKKIKKKRAAEMKKYEETIQHMKELREETYQRKNNELKKKLKNKEQLLITMVKVRVMLISYLRLMVLIIQPKQRI